MINFLLGVVVGILSTCIVAGIVGYKMIKKVGNYANTTTVKGEILTIVYDN